MEDYFFAFNSSAIGIKISKSKYYQWHPCLLPLLPPSKQPLWAGMLSAYIYNKHLPQWCYLLQIDYFY